ncbi:MAG: flagellar type III secretion system pore protein FliP [Rhizobiaceae bacterium]|jgi:flagellar biosynthetic protein FliP|nr:flagellar type III secretion system pore protein FliP [Rhizobiaceae bacterium]
MRAFLTIAILAMTTQIAAGQEFQLGELVPQGEGTFSARIIQGLVVLTVLSLAPGLLITTTCFTRFIISFSFLRSGLGLQSTPSNLIVISLSLFMTYFVMAPIFEQSWKDGVKPLLENSISQEEAFEKTVEPLKKFMLQHIREKDIDLFEQFVVLDNPDAPVSEEPELRTIVPAFLLSELRRGFEIGFLILLPFLVIDLVVSTVTMSMGMMMLPPTVVSLPFKVLFFILIDGWNLLVGELLKSVV